MKSEMPRSPFSTGLSGSAGEMEGRVRNILQGRHRRPAVWLLLTVLLLTGVSGTLVSCDSGEGSVVEEPETEESLEQTVQQEDWNLDDPEVALWREGHDRPVGPRTAFHHIIEPEDGEETVVERPEFALGFPGCEYAEQHSWRDFTVICCRGEQEDACSAWQVHCWNPEFYTARGIRVGSTREEVLTAYPEISPMYIFENTIMYYSGGDGVGPLMMFHFEENGVVYDTVRWIECIFATG